MPSTTTNRASSRASLPRRAYRKARRVLASKVGGDAAPIRILVLTNRDSDNVGDQIIEATVISLLKAVMKNLGIPPRGYRISSRAAGIIPQKYLKTGDPALLTNARKLISAADVLVFGGAPLFNYRYQNFYQRTITTLELAQEYGVPVLFSSVGVEAFDPDDERSLRLKDALALPCVRQITTRDDLESAQKYVDGTGIPVAHVSDPAVFADIVLGREKQKPAGARKTIGLVTTRSGIFTDNRIDFTATDQWAFWLDVIQILTERGYDYRLFTTGHFADELLLDRIVRTEGIPLGKVAVTVNSPEELVDQLTACDGVIAYRLHASITSYAYDIPSIGLSWNFKVPYFYESVGYGHRALPPEQWTAPQVVAALEQAMADGVVKDEAFLMSVYETLFAGLKAILKPESPRTAYSYRELRAKMPRYDGTVASEYRAKVGRKLRRMYEEKAPKVSRPVRTAHDNSDDAAALPR